MNSPTLELASALIARPSVTPEDAGCQQMLIERLEAIGFDCETMVFGEVTNLGVGPAHVEGRVLLEKRRIVR